MKLKWPHLILIFLSLTLGNACSKNQSLFNIETFVDLTIPAGSNTFDILGFEQEVILPYSSQLNVFNKTDAEIERVVADRAFFLSKFEDDFDLDFINVIEINAINPVDRSISSEIFYYDPIPLGRKTEIDLFPSIPNLKDKIVNDRVLIQVEMQFRRPPPRNLDIRIDMIFRAVEVE